MGKWGKFVAKFKQLRSTKKIYVQFTMLIILLVIIVVGFNNCGGVQLQVPPINIASVQGDSTSTFQVPLSNDKQYRIVFFVDMSLSMQAGLCPNDEASINSQGTPISSDKNPPKGTCGTYGLRDGQGADPLRYRLDILKQWVNSIDAHTSDANKVKYLIVPFTGGQAEANRKDNISFVTSQDALTIIKGLDTEQQNISQVTTDLNQELAAEGKPTAANSLTMGTSAPWNRLDIMEKAIQTEMTALSTSSYDTTFEIVYISDGTPAPEASQIKHTIRDIWSLSDTMGGCSDPCGALADEYVDGLATAADLQSCDLINHSFLPPVDAHCFTDPVLSSRYGIVPYGGSGSMMDWMIKTWGDYNQNTPNQIILKISEIRNLILSFGGANSRMSFALVNPLVLPPELNSDKENWVLRAKTQKMADRLGYITEDSPPFSLIGIGSNLEAYKIGSIFILNPYVRVDAHGNIFVDSSANGASDSDQIKAGLDPTNPRSNGMCLNSLTMKGLCPPTLSCDPHLDLDGDGLNECEEIILGTDPNNFDTDGDSIPDSLEYLYGYNPLVNDIVQYVNGSQNSSINNFKMGLPPLINPSNVNPSYITQYTMQFMNYVQQAAGTPSTGMYKITVTNLPMASVKASTGWDLYYDRAHKNKVPVNLIGGKHDADVIPVLVLVRVDNNMNNGEVHWGYELINLGPSSGQTIDIDLSKLIYFRANNPQGVQ